MIRKQRFFQLPIRRPHVTLRLWHLLLGCLFCLSIICGLGLPWSSAGQSVTAQTHSEPVPSSQTLSTESTRTAVSWDDLRPPEVTDFVDPYADLTSRQLLDLAELSRLETDIAESDLLEAEREKGQRLRQKLLDQGLDVEWLLAQVAWVTDHYAQQATDTNLEMDGKSVKILGYILPITQTQDQVSDFLLVPFIGACVHVPPPPPNQIVYVKPDESIENPGLFAQVWLEGILKPEMSKHEIFRVDGEQQVQVSYTIAMDSITPYQSSTESSALSFEGLAPGHLPLGDAIAESAADPSSSFSPDASYYKDYPLWQRIQIQTSALFTQTMVGIKHQKSWYALPLGLFVAFGYGVLHTLGPGHGKAVIVSYFIGKEGSLQRGMIMGVRIAIFHVISAILIVLVAHVALEQTIGNSASSYRIVRLLSYASIAVIGGWMLWKAARSTQHGQAVGAMSPPGGQANVPASSRFRRRNSLNRMGPAKAMKATNASLLYPTLTEQVLNTPPQGKPAPPMERTAAANAGLCSCFTCMDRGDSGNWLSVAVGAVPCSGALLVLLYGLGNDLLWPSILMVLSISLGMAITLSAIGVTAIWSQNRTRQRIRFNLRRQRWWSRWVPILGASSVFLIGLFMFGFTLATAIADLAA